MVVMAALASAKCCIGRRRCSSMPNAQPAKMMQPTSTARLAKIIATPWRRSRAPVGERGGRVALGSRPRQLAGGRVRPCRSFRGAEQIGILLGIRQGFPRPDPGRRRQMRSLDVALAKNVEDLFAGGEEVIGDDAAMAAPPEALRAHHARTRAFAQFPQGSK